MDVRRPLTAIGAGITVFLGVAVAVIELLPFEFSAILGLPVGLLAGVATAAGVLRKHDEVSRPLQLVAVALAGFGYGVIGTLGANYVNIVATGFETTLAVGAVAGLLGVVASVVSDRRR